MTNNSSAPEEEFEVRDLRDKERFVIDDKFLNGYAKYLEIYAVGVYCSLCRHANKQQKCWPSIEKIAEELGIGRNSAIEAIKRLEFWRIIIKQRIGKTITNRYILTKKTNWKVISEVCLKDYSEVCHINFKSLQDKLHKFATQTSNSKETQYKGNKEEGDTGKPAPSAEDSFLKAKEFQAPDPRKNPHGIIIDFYFNRVKELYGFEPEINGKKDGQLLKTRLTKYKPTQICALIDWYLHSDISERLGCSLAIALSANTINRWKQENGNK